VLAAAVGTRFLQLRAKRSATPAQPAETQIAEPTRGL